ncbi:MAG TPA: lipid II flippase MurJ, partial [candidate division Zixibacteria bacterium]
VDTCTSSVKLVFFLTLPSAFFLGVASKPIISLLYQHGQFSFLDTVNTSGALIFYSIGLFGYASSRVLVPAFYSVGNAKTPVTIGIFAVALNVGLNLILMGPLGFRGLAFGTSIAAIFNMFFLIYAMNKIISPINTKDLVVSFVKILFASAFMGMCLTLFLTASSCNLQVAGILQKIILVLLAGIVCLGSYFLACYLLKIKELERFLEMIRLRR